MNDRFKLYDDPVGVNLIIAENMMILLDGGIDLLHATASGQDMNPKCIELVQQIRNKIDSDYKILVSRIQTPIYSPDHPYGKRLMDEAMQHFQTQ